MSDQVVSFCDDELPSLMHPSKYRPLWDVINIDYVVVESYNNYTPSSQ
jgi:hypothetical protein